MGAGISSPDDLDVERKLELLTHKKKTANQKVQELLSTGLWDSCNPAERDEVRRRILADPDIVRADKITLCQELNLPLPEVGAGLTEKEKSELKNQVVTSKEPIQFKYQTVTKSKLWDIMSIAEKDDFFSQIRASDMSQEEKWKMFDSLPLPAELVKEFPEAERKRFVQNTLQSGLSPGEKAKLLLDSACWVLVEAPQRSSFRNSILASKLPNEEKLKLASALGLQMDKAELETVDKRLSKKELFSSKIPLPKKCEMLVTTGVWDQCDEAEREGFANKILAAPDISILQKKEALETLGIPEFVNFMADIIESDEPLESRVEALIASGCWEICTPEEKDGFKDQILMDEKLSKDRKEELFMLLSLPEADLPSEEKEVLKFEILSQDTPVEERLEFLLESNLWMYCLKTERERFKQEILQRSNLSPERKTELFKKLGVQITPHELSYKISRTTTQEDQKRAVVGLILNDDKLNLSEKADLLQKFQIYRFVKKEEDKLMRLILHDSRHLTVKRALISRYRIKLSVDHKKKLKQYVLKSTDVSLDDKRNMLVEFRLGSLTVEEKETLRHQILQDSSITMEEKRVLLIEFQIIKDSEKDSRKRLSYVQLDADSDEEDANGEGHVAKLVPDKDELECRQRIKSCFKLLKRDALRRRWEREAKNQRQEKTPKALQKTDKSDWARWLPGAIQGEEGEDSTNLVLEVGSEAVVKRRVLISDSFFTSEVGIAAEPKYRTRKTKHGTFCLVIDTLDEHADDEDDGRRESAKPLDYWLGMDFKEIILHVAKTTAEVINDRHRAHPECVPVSAENGKGLDAEDMENIVQGAVTLLEEDQERYVLKCMRGEQVSVDYFTDYEYNTFLVPGVAAEPFIIDFEVKCDGIINLPVHTCHTYGAGDVAFARFVLQLVNPPSYGMYIVNTIVNEMKLDSYRYETSDTFKDVMSLINAVAALGVPNPTTNQLRHEIGPLAFHRLMYTTTPKLLGKIKPLHDLINREFIDKVLKREAPKITSEDGSVSAAPSSVSSARKVFEKLLASTRKVTAVISRSNFDEILVLLRLTGHMATSVRVESSNLESVLQTVEELRQIVSLNFLFIRVVGSLSITDLSRLVRQAEGGSVRLLLINSGNLIQQLQLGGNLESVYITDDIGETSTLTATPYYDTMRVSRLINHLDITEEIFLELDFEEEVSEVFTEKQDDWRTTEELRLQAIVEAMESDTTEAATPKAVNDALAYPYLVIRTHDVALVVAFYNGISIPGLHISIQDAKKGRGIEYDQLKSDRPSALVVINSDLLSHVEKTALFERVLLEGSYLVLVTTRVSTDDLSYQPQQFKGLHSFQAKLVHARAAEDDIMTQVQTLLDRMEAVWSQSDMLYVSITFRVIRLLVGVKMSLQVMNEQLMNALRRRSPEDLEFITDTIVKQAEGMLDPGIFDIYQANVAEMVRAVCAQVTADEIYDYPEQRDPDEPVTVVDLAKICQSYIVHCLKYDYDVDLPFDDFIHSIPVCQFLSQRQRIKAWLVNVVGDVIYKESEMDVQTRYNILQIPDGNNTHSNYLLSYFVPDSWHRMNKSVPMYLRVKSQEFELEELIIQRATEMEELSWEQLRSKTFPKNLEFLMDLLSLYPYPLKVLCCIAERKLFVNLLQANNPRFLNALKNLERSLSNKNVQTLLANKTCYKAVQDHLAIVRWCLFGSGAIKDVLKKDSVPGLEVTDEDITCIIRMKLPFSAIAAKKGKRQKRGDAGGQKDDDETEKAIQATKITLDNVLRKICTFDLDDFLFKEVVFQKHLIRDATPAVFSLDKQGSDEDGKSPLGSVVINFIIHPIITKHEGTLSPVMGHPFVKLTQILVDGKLLPNFEIKKEPGQPLGALVNPLRSKFLEAAKAAHGDKWKHFLTAVARLTEPALAVLILKASQHSQTFFLAWLLEHILTSKQDKDGYLRGVITKLVFATSSLMRFFFLELLFRSEKLKPVAIRIAKIGSMATGDDQLDNALYALSVSDLSVQGDSELDPQRITGKMPVQHLPCLCNLVIANFKDNSGTAIGIADRALAMFDRAGFSPLYKELTARREKRLAEGKKFENSALLLVSWAMHPYEALDTLNQDECKNLLDVIKIPEVDFYNQVKQNMGGVSPLALFFVLPCALSYTDVEYFSGLFDTCKVERSTAIICQDGVMYPPYLLRYPKGVKLPDDILEDLDENLKEFKISWNQIKSLFKSYPTSSEGSGDISIAEGSVVTIKFGSASVSTANEISVDSTDFPIDDAKPNNPILIDGGLLLTITAVTGTTITATAKKSWTLGRGKNLCFPYENEKCLCNFKLNITSGVSVETVKCNLEALLKTTAFKQYLCTCVGNAVCVNCATCLIVQVVLWTWFYSIGATEGRLRSKWLMASINDISKDVKQDPDAYWRKMLPDKDKSFAGYSTNLPFPSVVNTRYVIPSSSVLFGNTDESKRKTVNYFKTFYQNKSEFKFHNTKSISYDEMSDACCDDLGAQASKVLDCHLQVNVIQHKKKGYDKKHINLEPLMNLLNPFVELLLQLLVYVPLDSDTTSHAREVAKTYLTYIERMLNALCRGFKRTLPGGDEQKGLKEAAVYRSLFSLIGKPLKHANKVHTLLFNAFSTAGLQKCGSSLKELRWLKWNKYVITNFDVPDPLDNENREFMLYPDTAKMNKLSLTSVKEFTESVQALKGVVMPLSAPPVQGQESEAEGAQRQEEGNDTDTALQHRGSLAPVPDDVTAPAPKPQGSFEDLPPFQTVDDRVQNSFVDCRSILGVSWTNYCGKVFVKPGQLVSLIKFEEGPLKFAHPLEKPNRKFEIINTFANNMYAWRFVRAHEGITLFTDGCIMTKASGGQWHTWINNAAHPRDASAFPEEKPEEEEKKKDEQEEKEKKAQPVSAAPDFGKFRTNTKKKQSFKTSGTALLALKTMQGAVAAENGDQEANGTTAEAQAEDKHASAPRQLISRDRRISDKELFAPFWVVLQAFDEFKIAERYMRLELLEKLSRKVYEMQPGGSVAESKKLPLIELSKRLSSVTNLSEVGRIMAMALGNTLKESGGTAVDRQDLFRKFGDLEEELASQVLTAVCKDEAGYQCTLDVFRPKEVKDYMQRYLLEGYAHEIFGRSCAEKSLSLLRAVLADNDQHKKNSSHRNGIAPHEAVKAYLGEDPRDVFFLPVDEVRDRCPYSSDRGQDIGFFLPVSVLSFDSQKGMLSAGEQGATKQWLIQFLVSPLPDVLKSHVLNKLRLGNSFIKSVYDYKIPDLNVIAMLYALASSSPVREIVDALLRDIRDVYDASMFVPYCLRVGARNEYGIHVVSEEGRVLQALETRFAFVPQVHLQDDQSVSNLAPLYSKIIEPFHKYHTCFVYVTGLQNVHDRLLKWVAEFTKSIPWAYVYFEGVDTTWNLPENTDRIFFHSEVLNNDARTKVIAATNVHKHGLSNATVSKALKESGNVLDGKGKVVSQVHKVHDAGSRRWVAFCDPDAAKALLDVETIHINNVALCMVSNLITYTASTQPFSEDLIQYIAANAGNMKQEERTRHWTDWIRKAEDVWDMDWKLIHGSPGIGKTYKFDEEIIPALKTYPQVNTAIVDGSSDKLVKFSLLDVLSDVPKPMDPAVFAKIAGSVVKPAGKGKGKGKGKGEGEGEEGPSEAQLRDPVTLVVLDEYHMMPDAQKRQLVQWYARASQMYAGRIKLVMIANRIDINDRDLLEAAIKDMVLAKYAVEKNITDDSVVEAINMVVKLQSNDDEDQPVITEEVREHVKEITKRVHDILDANVLYCRRGWEAHCAANKHIKAVVKSQGPSKEDSKEELQAKVWFRYFKLWLVSTRNLFGEDMMTFRLNDRLLECFQMIEDPAPGKTEEGAGLLGNILKKKMPSLPVGFCKAYCERIAEIFLKERSKVMACNVIFQDLDATYADQKTQPRDALDTIIRTSLININEQENLSYPDFSLKKIPNSFLYHPAQKITLWVMYMRALTGVTMTSEELDKVLHTLGRVKMRDLPSRFPQWFLDVGAHDGKLDTCEVICVPGDPRDLEWVTEKLKRGFSVDWDHAYNTYQRHNITNVRLFKDVVYQSEGIVLHYVPSDNLVSLIEIDEDEILNGRVQAVGSLSESICKHMQAPGAKEDAQHNNPFNVALWMLYKRWYMDEANMEWLEDRCTFDFFLWASLFVHKYMEHPDRQGFEKALSTKLMKLSEDNIRSEGLDALWSHTFAHLMKVSKEELSYRAAFQVTAKYYPPLLEWDDKIQCLCQLIHGHCTPEKLDILAADPFFWEELHAMEGHEGDTKMVQQVIEQMIKVSDKGDIFETTQVALLSQSLVLPNNIHHAYAYKFERGIKKLRGDGKQVAEGWDKKDQPFFQEIKQIENNLFLSQD